MTCVSRSLTPVKYSSSFARSSTPSFPRNTLIVGELRFDMFEAEFTHEGHLCTFEVLLRRFGLENDPALGAVAEIVHAIDLRDGREDRPERPGVERIVTGIAAGKPDDDARLAASAVLFDALYEGFQKGRRT